MVLLCVAINASFSSALIYAAPPVDEIRAIIGQKALRYQSSESLAALDSRNLDAGLQAIDPYARYVPPSVLSGNSSQSGHLGIEVFAYNSRIWLRPDPEGPADKAGVPEIGELQASNGKAIHGYNLVRISDLLGKAARNNHVSLTVAKRPGGKGRNYSFHPTLVSQSSISWRRVGDDVVLSISEFVSHDTAPGLSARYTVLVRPENRVVLDLRGCAGGDLYEALEIAGMYVPAGHPLVSTYDRSAVRQVYRSPSGKKLREPILILIDRRTASAAEILAGILQYHHLGRVVGEASYGKCVSQTLVPLSDKGGLWLTTLGINFPDNASCTGVGIKPDISYPDISTARFSDIIKNFQ